MSKTREIDRHYGRPDLTAQIVSALEAAGKDIGALTREDIFTFDEFHAGGRDETRRLAKLAEIYAGAVVLDIGAGIGGPARTLAAEFNCHVTGVDITREYCRAAQTLTEMVGLVDRTVFLCADAVNLPVQSASVDFVWMQFTSMNIEDKYSLVREVRRVLKPGGRFVAHEVVAGNGDNVHFPVFWAPDPSISFLWTAENFRQLAAEHGFEETVWQDESERSADWFRKMMRLAEKRGPRPLGLGVIVPSGAALKSQNVLRNIEEGKISIVTGIFIKG